MKDQCRLDIKKYSFSQRTINEWNKFSTDCVNANALKFAWFSVPSVLIT